MSKDFINAVKSIRSFWHIRPVTKVHGNNKKDKKKQRRECKRICKRYEGSDEFC